MKCLGECEWFIDNVCQKAQNGRISDITDFTCLLKIQIILMRSILDELQFANDLNTEEEGGNEWLNGKI